VSRAEIEGVGLSAFAPDYERLLKVRNCKSATIADLARAAGLDPAEDFRFADWSDVNWRGTSLEEYDLTGAIYSPPDAGGGTDRGKSEVHPEGADPPLEQREPRPLLFGRDHELLLIEKALLSGGSVTITGFRGMGKTSLATAALYRPQIVRKFGDRRLLISLEAEREPRALLAAIARSLRLPSTGEEASLLRQIQLAARAGPIAAVLDDCGPILAADLAGAERLLRLATQIGNLSVILITDGAMPRVPVAFSIESLPGLAPAAAREAFLAVAGDSAVDDPELTHLVDLLDGYPLAIALVAARAASGTSLHAIAEGWEEARATPFAESGAQGRSSGVRAALALALKSEPLSRAPLARRLLALLSVLPAGIAPYTVPRLLGKRGAVSKAKAAAAVAVLRQLHLIEWRSDDRLRLPAPLREAARLELSLFPGDRDRLIKFFSGGGGKFGADWERLSENLPAILRLAIECHHDDRFDIGMRMTAYYMSSGLGSIESFDTITQAEQGRYLSAPITRAASHALSSRGQYDVAERLLLRALDSDPTGCARARGDWHLEIANMRLSRGNLETAEKHFQEARWHFDEAQVVDGQAKAVLGLAQISDREGAEEAEATYVRALDLCRQARLENEMAFISGALDSIRRNPGEARFHERIRSYRAGREERSEAYERALLALRLQADGRLEEARQQVEEAASIARRIADFSLEALSLIVMGVVLRVQGSPDWEPILEQGFDLLRSGAPDLYPQNEGYEQLHRYILARGPRAREEARERTREAWVRQRRHDLIRTWLELPLHPD
jgi:tetratricopeptide (TPR) repeat protein